MTLWASLWIRFGGVGKANLAATTYMEAVPMKNSINTCVDSRIPAKASAHKSVQRHQAKHSEVKAARNLKKIVTKKSVRCGAALLRARLKAPPIERSQRISQLNHPQESTREVRILPPAPLKAFILVQGRFEVWNGKDRPQ